MEMENYYERQKELLALKEKLREMKNKENTNDLNQTLKTLVCLKNELFDNLSSINKNLEYINENITTVKPLLKSGNKINIKQKCAVEFKSIVRMANDLSDVHSSVKLQKENLNMNTEKLTENVENCIHGYNRNVHNTTSLFSNVQVLTNEDAMMQQTAAPILEKESSLENLSYTTDGMITFSEAIASSPL